MKRFLKRGRTGQSIVILALGFICLLAFVGIVTDVSLLFVRYSTLRRAVDAAAVAAATQMRRLQDTDADPNIDTGGSTSIANMNLAARQFLNLYSLDPSDVTVETCNSQLVDWNYVNGTPEPVFNGIVDDNGREVMSPEQQQKLYGDVCKDGRKLVRVTASIKSPTVFLRMLGMQDITLTVASISETAVLDVALVLDVSESMLAETTYDSYEAVLGHPVARILPGHAPSGLDGLTFAEENWWKLDPDSLPDPDNPINTNYANVTALTQNQIDEYASDNPTVTLYDEDYGTEDITFPAQAQVKAKVTNEDGSYYYETIPPENWDSDNRVLRSQCQTRFWPFASQYAFGAQLNQTMLDDYRYYFFDNGSDPSHTGQNWYSQAERAYFAIPNSVTTLPENPTPGAITGASKYYRYSGWVPTYDFYGCCNDPDGNGDFSDLACQPMKQARDASTDFLSRIDFPRGDAVSIITFSQSAHIIRPDGDGTDPWIRGDQQTAKDILDRVVGVRAEPIYYYDDPDSYVSGGTGYMWDEYNIGEDDNGDPIPVSFDYDYWNNTPVSSLTYFPVRNNCPFDMATLVSPYYPRAGKSDVLLKGIQTPSWLTSLGLNQFTAMRRSYDYRGSCRDTNMGGAMAASGNVFGELGKTRTEGSVWVMVLLSDGAAGASDPIQNHDNPHYDDNGQLTYYQRQTNPYGYADDADGVANRDATNLSDLKAEYGAFGFCPYGGNGDNINPNTNPPSQQMELVLNDSFPFCSDTDPNSRHFCGLNDQSKEDTKNNATHIELGVNPRAIPDDAHPDGNPNHIDSNVFSCALNYDVDDYARDWADYVAGTTLTDGGQKLLPVIFTIGFNLTFDDPNGACASGDSAADAACLRAAHPEAYLGEELLRYIADAGDNFKIDDDYWQWTLGQLGILTNPDTLTVTQRQTLYGEPGPCESPTENPIPETGGQQPYWTAAANNHQMLTPGLNCGDYFNAPDQTELAKVFNEIASRMFTRLSQ